MAREIWRTGGECADCVSRTRNEEKANKKRKKSTNDNEGKNKERHTKREASLRSKPGQLSTVKQHHTKHYIDMASLNGHENLFKRCLCKFASSDLAIVQAASALKLTIPIYNV